VTGIERRERAGRVTWLARVRRGTYRGSATFKTQEEAAAWRAQTLAALRTGADPPERPKPIVGLPVASETVEDACREFVGAMMTGVIPYRPSTIETYRSKLELHVVPYIGRIPVRALRRSDILSLVEDLTVWHSQKTAAGARDVLRVVLERAVARDVIPTNPCAGLRTKAGAKFKPRWLSPDEGAELQAAADADADNTIGPFVAVALSTGLRRGELEGLVWGADGLDLQSGVVRVTRSRDQLGNIGPPKNGRSRDVPIGAATTARMREWRMASGRPPDGADVFAGWADTSWFRIRKAARLDDPQPRLHDLRHTFATWALASGLSIHAVADLLGHSDTALVLDRYGHALRDEVEGAGRTLDSWIATVSATGAPKR
jgi:integrase